MVVGARPPRHSDPARPDHCRHPVRLGAPETCRSGAMADREGDRTGAERAAPVAARLAAFTTGLVISTRTYLELDAVIFQRGVLTNRKRFQSIFSPSLPTIGVQRASSPSTYRR